MDEEFFREFRPIPHEAIYGEHAKQTRIPETMAALATFTIAACCKCNDTRHHDHSNFDIAGCHNCDHSGDPNLCEHAVQATDSRRR